MDPNSWVDLLFKYGPYAVLALFALWVAPRQTQVFLHCNPNDTILRCLCGSVAMGSWLVVALMIWFIYQYWPPRTVHVGSLGTHSEEAEFFPAHPNFFISTQLQRDGRMRWNFAIVTDTLTSDQRYAFTYYRDAKIVNDYEITANLLKRGPLRLSSDPENPRTLLYDHDNNPATALIPYPPIHHPIAARPAAGWMAAHAAEVSGRSLIRALASKNRYFRTQARNQLRHMEASELRHLLRRNDLPADVRRQIEAELRIRASSRH